MDTDVLIPRIFLRDPNGFGGVSNGALLQGSPNWQDGRLVALSPPAGSQAKTLIPKLTEVHCHLDKCHTLPRLGPVGGDLAAAIAAQMADKENWTEEDLRGRALRGLQELRSAGCRHIRSHIDWGSTAEPPLSWQVLTEIKDVQWAALTSIEPMADDETARRTAEVVAIRNGVLGSFVLWHPPEKIRQGVRNCFKQADRLGLMLDFHVDEALDPHPGLEIIADTALETGFEGPILCGHAVSLMDSGDAFARIAEKLARSNITICALPTTNLYLQGRTNGTPDRRGLTRLKELNAADVAITVGSDNVADAFCPVGQHDPKAALHLAILSAHLDPPFERWLPLVTTNAARALGQEPIHIDGAHHTDLLSSEAQSVAELISGRFPLKEITL